MIEHDGANAHPRRTLIRRLLVGWDAVMDSVKGLTSALSSDPDISVKEQLLAWWNGTAPPPRRPAAGATGQGSAGTVAAGRNLGRNGKPLWTATRIEVAEMLWGEGFVTPGADAHIPEMIRSLNITPAKGVVDLSAGLGGAARLIAEQMGAWVDGLEANPLLASEAMARQVKAKLGRRAPVATYDPETFRAPRRVDVVFAKESFFTIQNKAGMVKAVAEMLKPGGQIMFTDYTAADAGATGLASWRASEPVEPSPWPPERWAAGFSATGMDVRSAEDITDQHRSLILAALQAFTQHLEKYSLEKRTTEEIVSEVSLWAMRVAALDRGLKVHRFHVIRHR